MVEPVDSQYLALFWVHDPLAVCETNDFVLPTSISIRFGTSSDGRRLRKQSYPSWLMSTDALIRG